MKRFSVKKLVASVSLLMVSALMPTLSLAADSCNHTNVANGQCQSCYCGVMYYSSTSKIDLPNWYKGMWGENVEYVGSIDIEGNRRAWIFTNPVTRIPDGVFGGNQQLISLEIPVGVTYVGSGFGGCQNLEYVSFPGTLKKIPEGIFGGCNKLNKVEIAAGVESVGSSAFAGCNSLKDVVIASSVEVIGWDAFPAGVQFTVNVVDGNVPHVNGPVNLTIDDNTNIQNLSKYTNIASVTYSRPMSTIWGTICLPFDVMSNDDVQYYQLSDVDPTTGVMSFSKLNEVKANTPCVVQKLVADNEIELRAANVKISEKRPVKALDMEGWSACGTYDNLVLSVIDPANEAYGKNLYYISNNKFWHATGKLTMKPFRAYFEYDGVLSSAASSRFSMEVVEANETGLDSVAEAQEEGVLYDLAGNRVENMVNGQVYILNGKKVMFK